MRSFHLVPLHSGPTAVTCVSAPYDSPSALYLLLCLRLSHELENILGPP